MDDAAARRQMVGTLDLLLAISTLAMGDEAPRVDVEQLKEPIRLGLVDAWEAETLALLDTASAEQAAAIGVALRAHKRSKLHRDWLRKAS